MVTASKWSRSSAAADALLSRLGRPRTIGTVTLTDQPLVLGQHTFHSRLFLGTGKYPSMESMVDSLAVSGTQCVTVAVRRLQLGVPQGKSLLDYLPRDKYVLLPNTAGCFDADHAIRTARLGRELGIGDLVKLEVLGDPETLLPDPIGTLEAAKVLVKEGFVVLCYTSDDPVLARRLEDAGVTAVMPAGAPIHDISVRMSVDEQLVIQGFEVAMDGVPYTSCPAAAPAYERMVGLRIGRGFLKAAAERIGLTDGCTHVRELLLALATVAVQTIYPSRLARETAMPQTQRRDPTALNTCRGWRSDSPHVQRDWPHLYTESETP